MALKNKEEKRKVEAAKLKGEVQERTKQLLDKQMKQLKVSTLYNLYEIIKLS